MPHNQKIEEILLSKLPILYLKHPLYREMVLLYKKFSPSKNAETVTEKLQKNIINSQAFDLIIKDGFNYYKAHVTPHLIDCQYSWYEIPSPYMFYKKNSIEWDIESCEWIKDKYFGNDILVLE